ncbi:B-box zinc finger protein 23 [Castanea sativa]|uniref:B-box zinc finger protein 23 n=1 Tax=Castanea sativa TaxID=21020 RepID=UPI003F650BDC
MKIRCDVCEKVEAEVLCCADEAVLCRECDGKVHAANKLSQKHERVLLKQPSSSSSFSSSNVQLPPCDLCQERIGYLFCLEDRASLCTNCDVSTHMGSLHASSHQRFLNSGIHVALHSSIDNNINTGFNSRNSSLPMPETSFNFLDDNESRTAMTMEVEAGSTETRATFSGETHLATEPSWSLDEIFDPNNLNYYDFSEVRSSRISSQ